MHDFVLSNWAPVAAFLGAIWASARLYWQVQQFAKHIEERNRLEAIQGEELAKLSERIAIFERLWEAQVARDELWRKDLHRRLSQVEKELRQYVSQRD